LIRRASYLSASERMTELMKQHNAEERQVLEYVPALRGVASFAVAELKSGKQKPGPVQEDINPGVAKQPNGSLARAGHVRSLLYSERPGTALTLDSLRCR
jgi:hypothetical protein